MRALMRNGGIGAVLVAVMVVQAFCTIFFVSDIAMDMGERVSGEPLGFHIVSEIIVNVALVVALVLEAEYLRQLLRRQAVAERSLSVASGELQQVIGTYFTEWHLTPAEADIALFAIKGCSISEIAQFRGSAEGTIKTHLNAIYRKAAVTGRAQLVSLLIEDLLGGPVGLRAHTADMDPAARLAAAG